MTAVEGAARATDRSGEELGRLLDQPAWQVFADALLVRAVLLDRAAAGRSPDPLAGVRLADDEVLRLVAELTGGDEGPAPSAPVAALADALVLIGREAFDSAVDPEEPLGAVSATSALSGDETAVLALAVAVELDPRRQRLVGYLNDDVTQPWLTPSSLTRVLEDADARLAVGPGGGLRRACLVEPLGDRPWASTQLRPRAAVVWWLTGDRSLDPGLPPELEHLDVDGHGLHRLLVVAGPDRVRRLQAVTRSISAPGFLVTPPPSDDGELDALVRRASLSGEAVVLEVERSLPAVCRARIERAFHLPWAVVSPSELAVRELPRRPWSQVAPDPAPATAAEVAAVLGDEAGIGAALTAEQLDAAATARAALGSSAADAIRRIAAGHIEQLATRIPPTRTWDDLVLEPYRFALVQSIVERATHRDVVYGEWGFSPFPSTGVTALFSGASGTGKTLAAEIVAGELGLDLYRIDLSQMVSKYIGETEKNLSEVFSAAEASPVVLFFDEADALLGKRSEVSDAHDRYANLEVAYLLQRLERYNGVVVLATNLANNIDPAFLRRVHVSVEFPVPEAAERLRIWQRSIPESAPREDLDLAFLADRFELPGGAIHNAASAAAFLAAAAGTPLTMGALALGVKRELQKLSRLVRDSDFGPWAAAVARPEESP